MKLIRVGVDLAKNVFQVHGVDRSERMVWRRRLRRASAHHWARTLQRLGYRVRLIAPQFVKPYVKSNKNDANDAEATFPRSARGALIRVILWRGNTDSVLARALNYALHEPRRRGLFNELAEIGEPSRLIFRS